METVPLLLPTTTEKHGNCLSLIATDCKRVKERWLECRFQVEFLEHCDSRKKIDKMSYIWDIVLWLILLRAEKNYREFLKELERIWQMRWQSWRWDWAFRCLSPGPCQVLDPEFMSCDYVIGLVFIVWSIFLHWTGISICFVLLRKQRRRQSKDLLS